MNREPNKKFSIINIDGIEIKALRGGFYAYASVNPEKEEASPTDDGNVDQEDDEESSSEDDSPSSDDQYGFLLCKTCGTLIRVFPPDRRAKCCKEIMTPLIEKEITNFDVKNLKEMDAEDPGQI